MKNQNFSYKDLKNLLEIGHEIEFIFDNVPYSINNLGDDDHPNAWVLSSPDDNIYLADFDDRKGLFASLDKIIIKEKSIEEIIDKVLYDPSSLTIF